MTFEEKLKRVEDFRPIDDVFFEALSTEKDVCQEILRVILEDECLVVTKIIPQASKKNIYGRSVRLDVLCVLGNGTECNIEVQRSDNDDHLKRARFNASSITVKDSEAGEKFEKIIELYVVYISQFDIFNLGRTIYRIEPCIRETGHFVNNGEHQIFVNTKVKDGSTISELMDCFTQKYVANPKFPALSNAVKKIKNHRGRFEYYV